jgi:hypothetical protein
MIAIIKSMKTTKIVISIAAILLIFVFGFYLGQVNGKNKGSKEAENKLKPLIDLAFPKPPEEMKNINGVIKGVYGATIDLEINDLNDYLPHLDGSPQKKEIRYVYVTSNTKISLIDSMGNIQTKTLKTSDLKIGNAITVYSNENLRNAKKFDATEIQVIKS